MTAPPPNRLFGVVHLPPLPGAPRHALTMNAILDRAAEEADLLLKAGYDGVVVENFGDVPFFPGRVPAVTVAAMTLAVAAVVDAAPDLAVGVNVLRNDVESALAIAVAAGGHFVRANVHAGARVTDQGIVEGRAAETTRLRAALGASRVALFADVDVKHSAPLGARPLEDEVEELTVRGLADAVLVTGEATGKPAALDVLRRVKAASERPVFVASGARPETLRDLAEVSDGVLVGSALREGGRAGAPLDPARVAAFADAFRLAYG